MDKREERPPISLEEIAEQARIGSGPILDEVLARTGSLYGGDHGGNLIEITSDGRKFLVALEGSKPVRIRDITYMRGKTYGDGVDDLHNILQLAMKTLSPETAQRWLVTPDPFLEERRPIDVLASEGPERVIAAIAAHGAGVYP